METPVAAKPVGFVNFVAWATLIAGLYFMAASLFGAIYLIGAGAGAKSVAYASPIIIGAILATAGFALMRGKRWSRFIYLGVCVVAILSLFSYLPVLLLMGTVGDPGLRASLASMLMTLLFSLKWVLATVVVTYFVFRHFRRASEDPGPTLAELTNDKPR